MTAVGVTSSMLYGLPRNAGGRGDKMFCAILTSIDNDETLDTGLSEIYGFIATGDDNTNPLGATLSGGQMTFVTGAAAGTGSVIVVGRQD